MNPEESAIILPVIVGLPIVAAIVVLLGAPARVTSLIAAAANCFMALYAGLQFTTEFDVPETAVNTFVYHLAFSLPLLDNPEWNLAFGLDGISMVLVFLTVIVTLAAVWVSPAEDKIPGSSRLYYLSTLLISAGALGAFAATDLFFFYAFHELALIPTFLMIGIFGYGQDRVKVAWKTTIYLGVGSLILLAGLIGLVVVNPDVGHYTFDMVRLQVLAQPVAAIDERAQSWVFLLLLIGFGVLVSLFPFHTWAAQAYSQAPTPTAMMHAGVLKKFGLYGLIRVAIPLLPAGAAQWVNLLLVLAVGNIIVLGLVTISQKKLDTLLANSSIMHMGYIFLGLAPACYLYTGGTIGIHGAVMLMFAHGVSIALMFALCGRLRDSLGTTELSAMGGLGKKAPALMFLFAIGAFASIGLPGFANFASEILVFFGAFEPMAQKAANGEFYLLPLQIAAILAIWGVVISAVYMLRAFRSIFMGPAIGGQSTLSDPTILERAPIYLLIATLMVVGFYPESLLQYIRPAVEGIAAFLN